MKPNYVFNNKNEFIIENYDKAKTFASFLPGIAGIDGIPMWAFYVNRGQVMGSFGVKDRDGTIMEFFPAHTMYQNIERKGFRTFIKYKGRIHEIFSSLSGDKYKRSLVIEKNRVRVVEENLTLGLRITVTYFTMPGESYAAMVRKVTVESLDGQNREIELLDGLPQLLPVGATNATYQEMSNLMKSWYEVYNTQNRIAYYKVRASTADTVEVREFEEGNFYLSFSTESNGLLPPLYDIDLIFGYNTALSKPDGWDCSIEELNQRKQIAQNKVSGGFSAIRTVAGERPFVLWSVIGNISGVDRINALGGCFCPEFIQRKEREAAELVEDLVADTYTKTAAGMFDKYIDQCYLDNILRGGYPLIFPAGEKSHVYHVFSRKHGDLEREYNFFSLEPALYSQGNGNFRDVCQNRRNDVLIKPLVKDFNVKHFMNLIQADGYNPLSVKGCTFTLKKGCWGELEAYLETHREEIHRLVTGKYTPGRLMGFITEQGTRLNIPKDAFLEKVLEKSVQNFEAQFGEGYWSDHWTYNLDLVETYLTIYPDNEEDFLFEDRDYCFYKSPVFVLPRADKYVIADGKVRQYGAVIEEKGWEDTREACWLRTKQGKGEIYHTNLFAKLLTLSLVKFVSLDPEGMGVEIEAGKPGWNDALNGLSGLFGSSLCETAELTRIVDFIIKSCRKYEKNVYLPEEITNLLLTAADLLTRNLSQGLSDFEFWELAASAKESYRYGIRQGISGKEKALNTGDILKIFLKFRTKMERGLEKALTYGAGIYPTYFTYNAAKYEIAENRKNPVNGYTNVKIFEFECQPLPLFLEGPARIMKIVNQKETALELYNSIRSSDIFDKGLKMYKTSVSLEDSSPEIGRLRAFTPGWLEREAVFLHMEYKYLYAMLRAGLYEQFFSDITTMLVPFMKPEVYGRSTLENSSFIASSANPDEGVHGRGFVARLSGSTAEMLSMWFLMMAGREVFTFNQGELSFELRPVLPDWLFDAQGEVSFRFLGDILVNYSNPHRRSTFGDEGAKPAKYILHYKDGSVREAAGRSIAGPLARDIREGRIATLDVRLQ